MSSGSSHSRSLSVFVGDSTSQASSGPQLFSPSARSAALKSSFSTRDLLSPSSAAPSSSSLLWSGFLRKKSPKGLIKVWQRRFFQLFADVLKYSKTEDSPPLGSIMLQFVFLVHRSPEKQRGCRFDIHASSGGEIRIFSLLANNAEECEKLVNSLQNLCGGNGETEATPHSRARSGSQFWKSGSDSRRPSIQEALKQKSVKGPEKENSANSTSRQLNSPKAARRASLMALPQTPQPPPVQNNPSSNDPPGPSGVAASASPSVRGRKRFFSVTSAVMFANRFSGSSAPAQEKEIEKVKEGPESEEERTEKGFEGSGRSRVSRTSTNSHSRTPSVARQNSQPSRHLELVEDFPVSVGEFCLFEEFSSRSRVFVHRINKKAPEEEIRAAKEAFETLATLEHPFLFKQIAVDYNEEFEFAVYEAPLDGPLKGRPPFPEAALRHIAIQLLCLLEYLHSCGLSWPGLCSDRLFLESSGHLIVCDPAFSKDAENSGDAWKLAGLLIELFTGNPQAEELIIPEQMSAALREFIDFCLDPAPSQPLSQFARSSSCAFLAGAPWSFQLDKEIPAPPFLHGLLKEWRIAGPNGFRLTGKIARGRELRGDSGEPSKGACYLAISIKGEDRVIQSAKRVWPDFQWSEEFSVDLPNSAVPSEILVRVLEQDEKSFHDATIGSLALALHQPLSLNSAWLSLVGRDGLCRGEIELSLEFSPLQRNPPMAAIRRLLRAQSAKLRRVPEFSSAPPAVPISLDWPVDSPLSSSAAQLKRSTRFSDSKAGLLDLEVCAVTDRLIALSLVDFKSRGQLTKFLEHFHSDFYHIFSTFKGAAENFQSPAVGTEEFAFEESSVVPELHKLVKFCRSAEEFLSQDSRRVLAFVGRRCALLIAACLFWLEFSSSAEQAMIFFTRRRFQTHKSASAFNASQRRYCKYLQKIRENAGTWEFRQWTMKRIRIECEEGIKNAQISIKQIDGEILFEGSETRHRTGKCLDFHCRLALPSDFTIALIVNGQACALTINPNAEGTGRVLRFSREDFDREKVPEKESPLALAISCWLAEGAGEAWEFQAQAEENNKTENEEEEEEEEFIQILTENSTMKENPLE